MAGDTNSPPTSKFGNLTNFKALFPVTDSRLLVHVKSYKNLGRVYCRAVFGIFQRPVSPLRRPSVTESSQNIALYMKWIFVRFTAYLLRSFFHMRKVSFCSVVCFSAFPTSPNCFSPAMGFTFYGFFLLTPHKNFQKCRTEMQRI